ncbi:cylicin-2-like [Dorcoceras hygrometricum]|uniref:Cylicin-2-like n=1 Tax=Dorcoceras hygrometricum TaxID=472368 RepID=A0A2Z7AT73_9LAMI|nr:cylicin-2-like [Dorcoceras hygrometricum]
MKSGKQVSLATVDRQSCPQPDSRHLRQPALEGLTNSVQTETPRQADRNKSDQRTRRWGGGTWATARPREGARGEGWPSGLWRLGYPRMRASGESSTTKHRLLHASGSHPIPPPNDPKRLAPTSFTRKPSLQTVGGGRSSIRSTTGNNLPLSICTIRSDGFCHGRNHLERLIGTSPTTLWTAATRRRYDGGVAAVRWRRKGAADWSMEARV